MTVNVRKLRSHIDLVNNTHVSEIDQVTLLAQLGVSIEILRGLNLPTPPQSVEIPVTNADDLTTHALGWDDPWENKRRLTRQLNQLLQHTIKDQGDIKRYHRMHTSLTGGLLKTAMADNHQMSLVTFMDSEYGRAALKRWGRAAREKHPNDLDSFHEMVSEGLDQARITNFSDYLDAQLPANQESPPMISEEDARTLAREYCMLWMAQTGKESLSTIPDPDSSILQVMINGMRESRWELPLVEGILTRDYWQAAINDGLTVKLPEHQPSLREECPIQVVLKAYEMQSSVGGKAESRGNIDLHYFDDIDHPSYDFGLADLIDGDGNHIAVLRGAVGPEIAFRVHPDVPGHLVVTAPGSGLTVINASMFANDPQGLKQAIGDAVGNLPKTLSKDALLIEMKAIRSEASELSRQPAGTISEKLPELRCRIQDVARSVESSSPNAALLARLSLVLSGNDLFESQPLVFAAPKAFGTIKQSNIPEAEAFVIDNGDGTSDVILTNVDNQPTFNGPPPIAGASNIPTADVTETLISMIKDHKLTSVGNRGPGGNPGMAVVALSTNDQLKRIGHWMTSYELHELTERSAIGILESFIERIGKDFPQRQPATINTIKEGLIGSLHGADNHPETLNDLYDELDFSSNLVLPTPPHCSGNPKAITIHPYTLSCLTDEDLRCALSLKAGLASPDNAESIINTLRTTNWSEAAEALACSPASPSVG